jgi:hypothetical protein
MSEVKSSIIVKGSISGKNIMVAGDNNVTKVNMQEQLPPAESVDIKAELSALREILAKLQSSDQKKINNAIDEAEDEAKKDEPDKDEVSKALERAMGYAKKAGTFTTIIETLKPHILNISGWLGENWQVLTKAIGM